MDFRYRQEFDSLRAAKKFMTLISQEIGQESELRLDFKSEGSIYTVEVRTEESPKWIKMMKSFSKGEQNEIFKLFTDGGSRGNPGPGACGFVLLDKDDKELDRGGEFFTHCTNNFAEYQGLKQGIERALSHSMRQLEIYMDSQLIVKQIKGEYKIKNKDLKPIYDDIKSLLANLEDYEINFVPRRYNQLADQVANQIMDQNL